MNRQTHILPRLAGSNGNAPSETQHHLVDHFLRLPLVVAIPGFMLAAWFWFAMGIPAWAVLLFTTVSRTSVMLAVVLRSGGGVQAVTAIVLPVRVAVLFWPDGLKCLYLAFFSREQTTLRNEPLAQQITEEWRARSPLIRFLVIAVHILQALIVWYLIATILRGRLPWWLQ